ncbi:hypothetical protein BDP81DRAFT_488093 [Colletotrichum phormii]|uniref:Nephrocystin 3-like N-terminal domain-containing protein n=1 Tax=Colletotrichum phormii TaxID=359342 RepID=A0AAJ0EPH8_9PEZI|nr:uncharacterized protein BDP81DRAFT_488093 [Colletotrichum phormii]KAK1656493.1 hypothetical protein BDP81DRAFT_488093 [Colletotrichum phormii]
MHDFSDRLQVKGPRSLADSEQDLCDLANECDIAAGKILTLIERIRPQDTSSILQTYYSIWKRAFYREDMLALEARLASYRSRIQLQLIDLTRDARDNSARLQEIESVIEKLRAGVHLCSLSDSVKENVEKLVRVSEIRLEHLAQVSILQGLRFDTMYHHYDMVCEAHKKTFRWILSDKLDERCNADCPNRQQKESSLKKRRGIRHQLTQWLSSGSGVFHFSAKLGAGKSTLMKMVASNHETQKLLETWAGYKTLICAKFFFWNSGSEQQKSISGLYLGLLHEVLSAHPELRAHAFSSLWEKAHTSLRLHGERMHISPSEALQGLDRLLQDTGPSRHYRFSLFVDGLDELQEMTECSHLDLTKRLYSWSTPSSGNVKICVASRPLNAFSEMAPPQQTICLHDLTKRHMALYVSGKLQGIEDDDILASISKAIVEKAQGIFFWTAVVAKDIREQIANGNDPENLIQQINQLPEEINDLFAHILHSLTARDQRRAYQVLAVLLRAQTDNRSDLMTITVWGAAMIEESQGIPYPELFSAF